MTNPDNPDNNETREVQDNKDRLNTRLVWIGVIVALVSFVWHIGSAFFFGKP